MSFRFRYFILLISLFGIVSQRVELAAISTWSWMNPLPQGEGLSTVTQGKGLFVAGGPSSTILRSSDGEKWDLGTIPQMASVRDLAFGNHIFIAVGEALIENAWNISISEDGVTWS